MADKPKCLSGCYYFGWGVKIRKACFHPDASRYLALAPVKCALYESDEAKALPGKEPHWKKRLTLDEFKEKVDEPL